MATIVNLVSLATFTALLACGQVLFKQVGLSVRGKPILDGLMSVARSPAMYEALALYGIATLLWVWILSRVSLSQAYPWVALGVVIVPILGWLVFDERVGSAYWLGVAFIIVGILLTQYSAEGI